MSGQIRQRLPTSAHIPRTLGRCTGDGLGDQAQGSDGALHYQGRYRDLFGAKRAVGTYPSHRQALKAANRAEGKVADGTWLDPNAGTITFQQYAQDVWLPSRHLEVTTRAGYQSYLRMNRHGFVAASL